MIDNRDWRPQACQSVWTDSLDCRDGTAKAQLSILRLKFVRKESEHIAHELFKPIMEISKPYTGHSALRIPILTPGYVDRSEAPYQILLFSCPANYLVIDNRDCSLKPVKEYEAMVMVQLSIYELNFLF